MKNKDNVLELGEDFQRYPIPIIKMDVSNLEGMTDKVPHVKIIDISPLQTLAMVVTPCNKPISKILLLDKDVK